MITTSMTRMITKYLWILLVVACIFALLGCGQVPLADKVIEQHEAEQAIDETKEGSIPNFQGIADALGCVFAPQSCQK